MSKEVEEHVLKLYTVKDYLSSGAYGHVWSVIERKTGRLMALKKIFNAFQNPKDSQCTYREISMLQQLSHEQIVTLECVIRAKNNIDLYLVFQYLESDLYSILKGEILSIEHIKYIIYQLCKVIKYLHSAQIIHRDLKSSNILINSNCQIKLCDFGLVRSLLVEQGTELVLTEQVATRWYRSPEMLLSISYDKPTDMWSLGCIIAELLMGEPIFPGEDCLNQIIRILEFTGVPEDAKDLPHELFGQIKQKLLSQYFLGKDPQLTDLAIRLLRLNPKERLTASEVLQHPAFAKYRQQSTEVVCNKFICLELEDNKGMSIDVYRDTIYKDIQRRYPSANEEFEIKRSVPACNSLFNTRLNSIISPHRRYISNSIQVLKKNKETFSSSVSPKERSLNSSLHQGERHFQRKQNLRVKDILREKNNTNILRKEGIRPKLLKRILPRASGWKDNVRKINPI